MTTTVMKYVSGLAQRIKEKKKGSEEIRVFKGILLGKVPLGMWGAFRY